MDAETEKLQAAVEYLEDLKRRRAEDRGAIEVPVVVSVGRDSDNEALSHAIAEAEARVKAQHPGKEVIPRYTVVFTGVSRHWEKQEEVEPLSGSSPAPEPVVSEAAGAKPPPAVSSPPEPKYVWVQIGECADATDPGQIKEARWYEEAGEVVLLDMQGNWLASQPLFPNQDPASLARSLLRGLESADSTDFNRKISSRYSYSGIA